MTRAPARPDRRRRLAWGAITAAILGAVILMSVLDHLAASRG